MLIKLADLGPKSYCDESFVFNFRAVRFWDGSLDPNVLYIVSASQLPPEPSEINGASKLLCIMDAPLHSGYTDGGVHLITFPAAASPIAIYNCLSTHLVDLFDGSASLQTLISRLVRGNFDEILISISKILRKSVILFAFNLQMISSAAYLDDRPSCWDSVHKLGYYPNFYNLASKLATGELLIYTKNRQLLPLRQMPAEGGEVFAPIIADNLTREILGYIFFYEANCDAIVDNSESLAFICHTLSWRMWKITHTRDRSHALLTDTLYSVLDGAITDDQVITSAMTRAGMHQRGYKLLIVVSSGSGSPGAAVNPAEKWPELFKDIWTDSFSFLYNGDLILIVHAESPDALMDQTLRKLQERLSLRRTSLTDTAPGSTVPASVRLQG